MKTCPICGLDYSDEAQFCAKCKTVLIDKPEPKPPIPTNYKKLAVSIGGTLLFIGVIYGFVYLLAKLTH